MNVFIIVLVSIFISLNCKSGSTGGGCKYRKIPGEIQILSIEAADPKSYGCKNDPVKVEFEFTANHNKAKSKGLLTVGAGLYPPRNYMTTLGIKPGGKYPAVKDELLSGSCNPVTYGFLELNFLDYENDCW